MAHTTQTQIPDSIIYNQPIKVLGYKPLEKPFKYQIKTYPIFQHGKLVDVGIWNYCKMKTIEERIKSRT